MPSDIHVLLTLQPPDLGGGAVALVVARRDPEYDGGLGGRVDMRCRQRRLPHHARIRLAAVHAHERQRGLRRLLPPTQHRIFVNTLYNRLDANTIV